MTTSSHQKEIAIYGAGGLGREIACVIYDITARNQQWKLIGFYDDSKPKGTLVDGLPVLGGLVDINAGSGSLSVAVGFSDPTLKRSLIEKITNPAIDFPVLIHPSCVRGNRDTNSFGRGALLAAGVILTTHVSIGDFVFINLAVTIGHDVRIGQFSSLMPGANISGNVTLGDGVMVGTGAKLLQNISIGADAVIGAGAVVTKSFGDRVKLVGVPATNIM